MKFAFLQNTKIQPDWCLVAGDANVGLCGWVGSHGMIPDLRPWTTDLRKMYLPPFLDETKDVYLVKVKLD